MKPTPLSTDLVCVPRENYDKLFSLAVECVELRQKLEGGVRVFISENGLLYRNLTDTKPNATLLLDKPEGA